MDGDNEKRNKDIRTAQSDLQLNKPPISQTIPDLQPKIVINSNPNFNLKIKTFNAISPQKQKVEATPQNTILDETGSINFTFKLNPEKIKRPDLKEEVFKKRQILRSNNMHSYFEKNMIEENPFSIKKDNIKSNISINRNIENIILKKPKEELNTISFFTPADTLKPTINIFDKKLNTDFKKFKNFRNTNIKELTKKSQSLEIDVANPLSSYPISNSFNSNVYSTENNNVFSNNNYNLNDIEEENINVSHSKIIKNIIPDTSSFTPIHINYVIDDDTNLIIYKCQVTNEINQKINDIYGYLINKGLFDIAPNLLDTRIYSVTKNPIAVIDIYPDQIFNYFNYRDSLIKQFPKYFDQEKELQLIAQGDPRFILTGNIKHDSKPFFCIYCDNWISYSLIEKHLKDHHENITHESNEFFYEKFKELSAFYRDFYVSLLRIENTWLDIIKHVSNHRQDYQNFLYSPTYCAYKYYENQYNKYINLLSNLPKSEVLNASFISDDLFKILQLANENKNKIRLSLP